jgi:putative sterol carrier protein
MTFEEIEKNIKHKLTLPLPFQARVKFDFGDKGILFIDSTKSPPEMSYEDSEADVSLYCDMDLFASILQGTQDPNIAYMMGKLKVKGSMGLAMKLNSFLED